MDRSLDYVYVSVENQYVKNFFTFTSCYRELSAYLNYHWFT